MSYRRVSTPVLAWQYANQPKNEWPKFVTDYKVDNAVSGPQSVGLGLGVLLVPSRGQTIQVQPGDWLVIENDVLQVFKNETFFGSFEPIIDEPANEASE